MTDIKSILQGSSGGIRKQISEQRADAEMAQGAFLELLCDHYDSILEVMAEQIDSNSSAIDEQRNELRSLREAGAPAQRYTPGRVYRELTDAERVNIALLVSANQVTPIGLSTAVADRDVFDEQDQQLAAGEIDQYQQTAS